MTRLLLVLLASCAAAQATTPPAVSVINDQHTTGGTGPVTSAQAYVKPPVPEAPAPRAIPREGSDSATATDEQLVAAELRKCRHPKPPLVVAQSEPLEPMCAATKPAGHKARHRRVAP